LRVTGTESSKISDSEASEPSACREAAGADSRPLYALIAQQAFFKGFSPEHLRLFTDSAREMQFEAGESILDEGCPANRFYLILEGKVVLGAELEDHGIVAVQTLGPGDDLGWSWLFPPYHTHLSARALAPTKTIFFFGTRLREESEQDHEFGYQLMKRITEVMIQRLRTTQQRLVECVSSPQGTIRRD
jgi:CRP/FNR family cyclic AMP-dependent transcriptional regulator